jgi:hypothetical protein
MSEGCGPRNVDQGVAQEMSEGCGPTIVDKGVVGVAQEMSEGLDLFKFA